MWGGRFADEPDPRIAPLLTSLPVDRHLLRWDLLGSLAHLTALADAGIAPVVEASAIGRALREMLAAADAGTLVADGEFEDVHSFIEAALAALQDVALGRIAETEGVVLPGYTHLQRAQPVLLAHVWLAYVWMLGRDAGRLRDAYRRVDVSPLGSGAIAGSSFPIDRAREASLLGFAQISENSIDATGDRDFVFETTAVVTGVLLHLSRWAEELILWATYEFGFINLPDAILTGSSLMPQKRNPDLLELTRAQAGVGLGALAGLGAVLKGVPPGYNRDLQEDKAAAMTAFGAAGMALQAMTLAVGRLIVNRERMVAALRGGFLTATEVADYLVRRGVPFREAHHLAGRAVRDAEAAGCELWELPLEA